VDSKTRIHQIQQFKPTVLVATPTYALRLAETALEMGVDPRETSIRMVATAGEPGAVVPAIRRKLETAWNAKTLDLYGISELWGSASWQCPVHPDRMHLGESAAYGIVLDKEGKLAPNGGKGEFVLTSYESTIQPLIKYRTRDLVEWHSERCDCGRTWIWLRGGVLARTDQMVTVKGTNVYPSSVRSILGEMAELSEQMEIHIRGAGISAVVCVKVEASPSLREHAYNTTGIDAEKLLRKLVGVMIPVEILPPGALPRYELKSKLVIDHREKGDLI
jgi:phenylacetate-CoA ligase